MARIVATVALCLGLGGCGVVGPLDPMCYPDSCIVWVLTHDADGKPIDKAPPRDDRGR